MQPGGLPPSISEIEDRHVLNLYIVSFIYDTVRLLLINTYSEVCARVGDRV